MKKIFFQIFLTAILFIFGLSPVLAYEIQDLVDTPVRDDFVLGPGKTELWMDPGDSFTKELLITNRLGKTMNFKITLEDFTGSRNPEETVVLLGEEKGAYSLKDYLRPEITEFTLTHGQRIVLPIEISIPEDAEPGGFYGVVLVETIPSEFQTEEEKEKAKGQLGLISRLGTLFFIRVKGDVVEDGFLKELKLREEKSFYERGPVSFELLFENNGNVHLTPYGIIEIKNLFGKKIDEVEIDPYFAMPDSLRLREIQWDKGFLFGRYTATVSLNRGYQDIIDQKSVDFWIIPWKIILIGLVGLFFIVWFLYWIVSRFEIKRKSN